jgi:hypothetical protein
VNGLQARSTPFHAAIGSTVLAIFAPWRLGNRAASISLGAAALLAVFNLALAAGLSTALSTWTYLAGKGLLMTTREMDMGRDDLPTDTVAQVVCGFAGSLAVWFVVLSLAMVICFAVADVLYRGDRVRFRTAAVCTCLLSAWFVIWAAGVFLANGVRENEVRHPAQAVRTYAQLNQHWFRGSSAFGPGPIEREPLVGRGRLGILALVFPIIWAVALPRNGRRGKWRMPALIAAAVLLSWVAWWAAWRILPWSALEALAG